MYQRILVPIDGSPTSNQALSTALQLAKDSQGRVRVIHVIDELAGISGYEYAGYSDELIRAMREAGNKILGDALDTAKAAGVEADSMLFDDFGQRLGETAADAAKRWNADLLVVGTHGRRGIGRMLLGSGAEQIIRLAPVPILVVRAPESAAAAPAA